MRIVCNTPFSFSWSPVVTVCNHTLLGGRRNLCQAVDAFDLVGIVVSQPKVDFSLTIKCQNQMTNNKHCICNDRVSSW